MTLPTRISRLMTVVAALGATLLACATLPVLARASTYVLRPSQTLSAGAWWFFGYSSLGWTATPSTSSAHQVLSRPVSDPAVPASGSSVAATAGALALEVAVPAVPAFGPGETLRAITVWAYVKPGTQGVTLSLRDGVGDPASVASTVLAPGSPAGWYSASTQVSLTAAQLNQLSISLEPGRGAAASYPVAYEAYVEVDTSVAPAATVGPTGSTGPSSVSPVILASRSVVVDRQGNASVNVGCARGAVNGCHGSIVLERAPAGPASVPNRSKRGGPSRKPAPQAWIARRVLGVASRCARGCRILGRTQFKVTAGHHKRIKLRVASNTRSLFGRHHRLSVLAIVASSDGGRHFQTTTVALWLLAPARHTPLAISGRPNRAKLKLRQGTPTLPAPTGSDILGKLTSLAQSGVSTGR